MVSVAFLLGPHRKASELGVVTRGVPENKCCLPNVCVKTDAHVKKKKIQFLHSDKDSKDQE